MRVDIVRVDRINQAANLAFPQGLAKRYAAVEVISRERHAGANLVAIEVEHSPVAIRVGGWVNSTRLVTYINWPVILMIIIKRGTALTPVKIIAVEVHLQLFDARRVTRRRASVLRPLAADAELVSADIVTLSPDPFQGVAARRRGVIDLEPPVVAGNAVASYACHVDIEVGIDSMEQGCKGDSRGLGELHFEGGGGGCYVGWERYKVGWSQRFEL